MKWILLSSVAIAILSLQLVKRNRSNVCKNFNDYYTDTDSNENCYYNPDAYLTTSEIIRRHGYPVEIHNTTTEDGYIITLFRIPHGKGQSANNTNNKKPRQPIFLLHGIGLNSESFINTGRKSLGFILADAGYDVWLGNFRGTRYARKHINLQLTDREFWDYSFHELGVYDVPAQVNMVTDVTKQKVIYIGYSMGTTGAFIYGSTYPEVSVEKVKIFICLSPAVFNYEWKSYTGYIMPIWPYMQPVIDWFTSGRVYLRILPPNPLRSLLCFPFPFQMNMCQVVDMLAWGFDYEQSDPETLPITLLQNVDTTSTKTITHLIQTIEDGGRAGQFDYGADDNRRIYGTPDPPDYDLWKFKVPVYLIRGENDLIVSKKNVERLNASLPEAVKPYDIYVVKHSGFNHGDFLQAKDVVSLLYDHILEVLKEW